jgi:hypothetical protein
LVILVPENGESVLRESTQKHTLAHI